MDPASQPPRPRTGLEIIRTGPRTFVLRHPVTGEQFELGADERFLLHLLARAASLAEVLSAYATRFKQALPERRLLEFLEQLRRLGLLEGEGEPAAAPAPAPAPAPAAES